MTLNEIRDNSKFSVRAFNVCRFNQLYNIDLILEYYSTNNSFINLRNCGEGTNYELIKFCKDSLGAKHLHPNPSKEEVNNPYLSVLDQLSRKQREVINSFILVNIDSLSIRSQNAIRINLRRNFKIKNFIQSFLSKSFDVVLMKNVGKKSIPEIEVFIQIVSEFIDEVNQTKDDQLLTILRNRYLIQKTFSLYTIPKEVLESESIFRLANFLLDKNALFNKKETTIIKKTLNVYDYFEEYTLDEIAQQIGLSRERVRQLRKKCIEQLSTKFDFLQNFNEDIFSK
jgi:RNA polymerase sigma factor (sigma-70 family)